MNSEALRVILQSLGYDLAPGHPLRAHKVREDAYAYELVIDRNGQLHFTATRITQPTRVVKSAELKRAYHITREQQTITVVRYELQQADDLKAIIQELERL